MTQPEDWPKHLTKVIAGQVQRLRSGKMSAQQLADATAALGHPVPRSVIANLESGRRDTVSVAELLVLARALKVPPLLLIFPVGQERWTEVLPGTTVGAWAAAQWFTGEEPFPVLMPDGKWAAADLEEWEAAATAYFRRHDALIAEWNGWRREATRALAKGDQESARLADQAVRRTENDLHRHRAVMRKRGFDPGELTADLAHVDQGSDDGER